MLEISMDPRTKLRNRRSFRGWKRFRERDEGLYEPRSNLRRDSNSQHRNLDDGKFTRIHPIGLRALQSLLEKEPFVIAIELTTESSGYHILIENREIDNLKLCLVIKLLNKAVTSKANSKTTIDLLLQTFSHPTFIKNLMTFISSTKYVNSKANEYIPLIGFVLEHFLRFIPDVAFPIVSNLTDLCLGVIHYLKLEQYTDPKDLEQSFINIQRQLQASQDKWQRPQTSKTSDGKNPVDDFRNHEVIPTCDELNKTEKPFLRAHIVKGRYDNSQHYLDVQFRLLKEDFVRPLREGLRNFHTDKSRGRDIGIYKNVTLEDMNVNDSDLIHYLKLNLCRHFRIKESKQLMYGNILCISHDNFETMVTATVKSRDELHKGLLGIKIETEPFTLEFNETYSIIESNAYFVSYMCTLKALKEFDTVPFKNYIVSVNESYTAPTYLSELTTYNFSTEDDSALINAHNVCVLGDVKEWPSYHQLKLDESQFRALHGALTRQMAIIQGPPGTGKTFLGLQIVRILLCNQKKWNIDHSPILVVCHTNHALEQFLKGIRLYTNRIIRVGFRCKSEILKSVRINDQFCQYIPIEDNDVSTSMDRKVWQELNDLKRIIKGFSKASFALKERGILSLDTFMQPNYNVIADEMRDQLKWITSRGFLFWSYRNKDDDDDNEEFRRMLVENEEDFSPFFHELDSDWRSSTPYPFIIFEITQEKILKFKNFKRFRMALKIMEIIVDGNVISIEGECNELESCEVHDLYLEDRLKLYAFWKTKLEARIQEEKRVYEKKYIELKKSLAALKDLRYLTLMKTVDVVGMTMTGAAQYYKVLRDLAPPIVIIEEAAEILEANVLASLSAECKHLIMIGDHQQLRPKPNVFELAKQYHLDTSLFERMIKNGIKYQVLEYQHRMKPLFSSLLVPSIYENLKDHASVQSYPKIRGVAKDLFFVDHTEFEKAPSDDNESFENVHEAEFLMGLCRHLILQDYTSDNITIITLYSGQFRLLKKLQTDRRFAPCHDVRVSILDNYQGEESNIILLSLVRSNKEENVGFVKIDNGVCVALSRAKHGMYIIGNMNQMTRSSSLWGKINRKLIDGGHIGPKLQLTCESHPSDQLMAGSYEEILLKSPVGGCRLSCSAALPSCTHKCSRLCHSFDKDHKVFKCTLPCDKILCENGHQCPKLCYQLCPPCQVLIEKELPCKHKHSFACSIKPEDFKCRTKVYKKLPCKHVVTKECHDDDLSTECPNDCSTRLNCGHKCRKKCHVKLDPYHSCFLCRVQCERISPHCKYEHVCLKACYKVFGGCETKIERNLECGHILKNIACGLPENLVKCTSSCEKTLPCDHPCPKLCGEGCGGCMVKVKKIRSSCQHETMVPCSVSPDSRTCNEKCERSLECGHPCKELCGKRCMNILKCREWVDIGSMCPKGHSVRIPCYVVHTSLQMENNVSVLEERVGEYCSKVCGAELDCGHLCKGLCGHCLNGRLHARCREKCGKSLVCGHLCIACCSNDCPSCWMPCLWKCVHSICRKRCGAPCINCKEKCSRRCVHSSCSAKCGDKCSQEPCSFPCPLKLKCNHPCIGFCGDPCPKLCRICDKDTVTSILLGHEDEDDARFVMLEDCEHVFEAKGLEKWMKTNTGGNDAIKKIGMKKCPQCNVAIYNTKRYQSLILEAYETVSRVKAKYYSAKQEIRGDSFIQDIRELLQYWPGEKEAMRRRLSCDYFLQPSIQEPISDQEFDMYSFLMNFLKVAKSVKTKLGGEENKLNRLVRIVMSNVTRISPQMMNEVSCELRRLEVSVSVEKLRNCRSSRKDDVKRILDKIDTLMNPTAKFDKEIESKVVVLLKEAKKYMGLFCFTNKERLEVIKAMGFKQGHWYACPQGHIYCIGDCGGAVTEAECPECGVRIGGSSHTLRADNRVATEMDGATRSAWPGGL